MVVVRSAKFCYRLLTLLAGAYLPRAPLPLPQKAPPPSIPATPTRPAQYGWSRQQRRDLGYPDGGFIVLSWRNGRLLNVIFPEHCWYQNVFIMVGSSWCLHPHGGLLEIIEMNDKLRNRQEIVNGLNIFLEENEEEAYLEELEEESDMFEEEETEALNEDGSKEAHNNVRTSHKVSLRSIASMTDEERFNMRIKKFGITSKEFRKSPVASCFGLPLSTGL
ncbi:uncharacterized protein LOC69397 isoform X1 [Mus musculus]|uniref:uncharacterized protein LOC69397 isoform X1 n=1 Tax=Mus musculus TaxID=10090 RepID=UPI0003D74857|nr:uncharacterized protein LOC69397 isoform X1 [Mus musculus]